MEIALAELSSMLLRIASRHGSLASAMPGVWVFRRDRPGRAERARTSTLSVIIALQGRKRIRMGDLELIYDPQRYIVLRGDTEFESQVLEASAERPYLAVSLQLPPELVMNVLLDLGEDIEIRNSGSHDVPAFLSTVDEPLIDALRRLMRAVSDPAERRFLAPLVLREITFRLLRTDAAAVLRDAACRLGDRGRIRDAMAFIDAHATRRLSVQEIARHIGMSPSHFAHRFREVTSVSPMQYVKHVRLDRARTLLVGDGLSAAEIAVRVGYESPSHFTRDFKRQFGFTPGRYARAFDRDGLVPVPLAPADVTVA